MVNLYHSIRLGITPLFQQRNQPARNYSEESHHISFSVIITVIQDSTGSNGFSRTGEEKKHPAPSKLAGSCDCDYSVVVLNTTFWLLLKQQRSSLLEVGNQTGIERTHV